MSSGGTTRELQRIIESVAASDGAGVKLRPDQARTASVRKVAVAELIKQV